MNKFVNFIRKIVKDDILLETILKGYNVCFESLNREVEYKWIKQKNNAWLGNFIIENLKYDFLAVKLPNSKYWQIGFHVTNLDTGRLKVGGIIGKADVFRVFATIKKMMTEFIYHFENDNENFDGLVFYAKEPSRKMLYNRFSKMIENNSSLKKIETQPEIFLLLSNKKYQRYENNKKRDFEIEQLIHGINHLAKIEENVNEDEYGEKIIDFLSKI